MSATSPIVLILGAGANVGQSVAQAFISKGYRAALVARNVKGEENTAERLQIAADFSDPNSIPGIFDKLKQSWGLPSVVVYNAAAATRNPPQDPMSLQLADFSRDLTINTVSVFAAAQQAVEAFKQLPESASRTFIYTGNILNTITMTSMTTLGVGKSASAHLIQVASEAYRDVGFKFYYTDERKEDGSPTYSDIDGEAHGKLYLELAEAKQQGPWQQTFLKGVGYRTW